MEGSDIFAKLTPDGDFFFGQAVYNKFILNSCLKLAYFTANLYLLWSKLECWTWNVFLHRATASDTWHEFVCVLFTVQDLKQKKANEKSSDEKASDEKNTDEDEAFQETEWFDFTYGYNSRQQKKVNLILNSCWQLLINHLNKKDYWSVFQPNSVFSFYSVALSISISMLHHVQVLLAKHLQLQEPRLSLSCLCTVNVRTGILLSVPLHRPPQGRQEAHTVLPHQTRQHQFSTPKGECSRHPSWKWEVPVSKMWISDLFYLCHEEAHHSQAPGQFGRAVYWLQIEPSRHHNCKDLLLQGLPGEHWKPRPDVASHAGWAITLFSQHTSAAYDLWEQKLHN